MESDYDKCLADNKRLGDKNKHLLAKTRRLQRVMTNLSNDNERFIADNIAKTSALLCFLLKSKYASSLSPSDPNLVESDREHQCESTGIYASDCVFARKGK
ncbi:hypothetical protein Tco_1155583 [Tanacetum coccineum]